jgi:hypothetical protein
MELIYQLCLTSDMGDVQGGIYFFQLMDYYTAAISLMFVALFETVAIVWCYGTKAGRGPAIQQQD